MENYSYSSYPESGDSSPRSREIECENPTPWEEAPPPAARVKLMCSYGGRIQPRQHDNQLSYVGGETKILAVDRAIRFPAVLQRLSSLLPAAVDICFKYQLPGEDLDALISVTNDEDLEHMMLEYDRLVRSNAKPAPRLRLFLFPIASPPAAQPADQKQWFLEALNAPPPPQAVAATAVSSPDFLFGFDQGFVPPPAVRTKDPAPEPAAAGDSLTVDVTARSDPGSKEVISPVEMQRQIQELQRLQIAENQQQQQQQQHPPAVAAATPTFQRNGSDDASAARAQPTEYYLPRAQEKAAAAPPPPPAAYWPDQRVAAGARFASMAGGEQPVYLIPAGYAPQAYYAMPRMVPAEPYRDAPALYAAAPPQQQAGGGGAGRAPPQQGAEGTGYTVAYDSAGRAVYYTSAVPTYQAVTSVGPISPAVDGSMAVKPPQAS